MAEGGFHFHLLLTILQLVLAVAIWRSGLGNVVGRGSLALVTIANAIVTLSTALMIAGAAGQWAMMLDAADLPTAQLLLLAALWFPNPLLSRAAQSSTTGITVVLALVAASGPLLGWRTDPLFSSIFAYSFVFLAYAFGVAVFTWRALRHGGSAVEWLLAAFLLRGADFAARFVGDIQADVATFTPSAWLLVLALVVAVAALALTPGLSISRRTWIMSFAAAGALLGFTGRSELFTYDQSFLTLSIGRPICFLFAVSLPRQHARMALLGGVMAAAYFVAVLGAKAAGMVRVDAGFGEAILGGGAAVFAGLVASRVLPDIATTEELPRRPTDDRILRYFREAPPTRRVTRRELAEALGVLPQNVPRAVSRFNAWSEQVWGVPALAESSERGERNQPRVVYYRQQPNHKLWAEPIVAPLDSQKAASQSE